MVKSYLALLCVCLSVFGVQASDDGLDDFAFDCDATGRIFDVADPDAMCSIGSIKDYEEGDKFDFLPFAGVGYQHDAVVIVRIRSEDVYDVHYSLWNGTTWGSISKFHAPDGTTIENVEIDDAGVTLFYGNKAERRFRVPDIRRRAARRSASVVSDDAALPVAKKQKRDV